MWYVQKTINNVGEPKFTIATKVFPEWIKVSEHPSYMLADKALMEIENNLKKAKVEFDEDDYI